MFFGLKKPTLNVFINLKISFFITSLHVLNTPNTICPYLKNLFWSKNIWYFGLRKESKYQIFLDQNIFLRYGHMVWGVLRTCKEVMKNEILRSINIFKGWFFQPKKNFFRKFTVEKWQKKCYFELWVQKTLLEAKRYQIYDIDIDSVKVWGTLWHGKIFNFVVI